MSHVGKCCDSAVICSDLVWSMQVSRTAATPIMLEDGSTVDVEGALRLLDEMVGVEDPHSGDCVVRLLQEPFIALEESQEVASWQL